MNGYDMRYEGWGEEDVDIATRLRRIGLRCGHAGPDATLIHLAHESDIPTIDRTGTSCRRPSRVTVWWRSTDLRELERAVTAAS